VEQVAHNFHVWAYMRKVSLEAGTQIVQSRLPAGRQSESILRTLAVTLKKEFTFAAIFGERIALVFAKPKLLIGVH
jgi:hypothetical protein